MSIAQKITEIEQEMARTQKNKATNAHLGVLKAKLAKLKREIITSSSSGSKGGKKGEGFDVSKTGDARIGLIGFPSVGKSTLMVKLTGTFSEIADYEFTTLTCVPGVFKYKGCKIQLLDLPGIIEGAKDGKGRGRQVIAVARTCHLLIVMMDATKDIRSRRKLIYELEGFGIRLNQTPPSVSFRKKDKGGISLTHSCPISKINLEVATAVCKEYHIVNADIHLRDDISEDQLIDVIEGNRVYMPCIFVLNKIDEISIEELDILDRIPHCVPICARFEWNFDELLEKICYTKPKGQIPDYETPVIIPRKNNSIESFCARIHRSLVTHFKYAYVWGSSVKHTPQKVGKDHKLNDEDVVQIVKRIK